MDMFDDGPMKPVRIWSRVGRQPILAGGNSNGDIPMLQYAGRPGQPGLRLLILHDDERREFNYVAGAEKSIEHARTQGWTSVSMKTDWDNCLRRTLGDVTVETARLFSRSSAAGLATATAPPPSWSAVNGLPVTSR